MTGFKDRRPKCVLVARLSALSDVIVSIPVVYSACRCHPETKFVYITKTAMQSLFINVPENLTVVGVDIKEKYSGIMGIRHLFDDLKHTYSFDSFIDLNDDWRTRLLGLLCKLHGIPVKKINSGRSHKRALTRKHNKVMLPLYSQRARYREVFYRMGFPVEERFTSLFGNEKGNPETFASVSQPKKSCEYWIGIAPFAKYRGKVYPLDLTEKVIEEISQWEGVKIFMFGGGEEESATLESWTKKYPNCTSLASKHYGFPLELALLSHLDVMVSMDSANMHLASTVGVTVVSIWGATHPYCGFKGWKQSASNTVQLSMVCRPCSMFGDKPCYRGDYHCLDGIPPQVIIDKIKQLINV